MPKGDREILKADPEDGTTPISNLLLEALAIGKLSGKEKGTLLYLCRKTYGWKDGKDRVKEAAITLREWSEVLQVDSSRASRILSGLVDKKIMSRRFTGPGKGYVYSINTRVAEWYKGCINLQLLSKVTRQPLSKITTVELSKVTTVELSKTTTPLATDLAMPKETIKETLKKRSTTCSNNYAEKNPDNNLAEISKIYENDIGMITPLVAEDLKEISKEFPPGWFTAAAKEAVSNNARSLKYIRAILSRWKREGFQSARDRPGKYTRGKNPALSDLPSEEELEKQAKDLGFTI